MTALYVTHVGYFPMGEYIIVSRVEFQAAPRLSRAHLTVHPPPEFVLMRPERVVVPERECPLSESVPPTRCT